MRSLGVLARTARTARFSFASRALSALPEYTLLPLPALSPTMETGNLASWNKAEGDLIEPGDVIAEVETDKAVVDYEAQETQYLAKILVAEGTKDVTVGATLGVLVEEEADIAAIQAADASEFGVAEAGAQTVAAAAEAAAPAPAAAAAPVATPPPPPPPAAVTAAPPAAATPAPAARAAPTKKSAAAVAAASIPIAKVLSAEWASYTETFGSTLMDSLVETDEE